MGGQMQELLIEVSRNLAVTQRLLQEVQEEQRRQSEEIGDLRERVAGLERDREWNGDERRKVGDRLETGDHTFLRIEQRAADAEEAADRAAQTAKTALDAIDAHTSGLHGKSTKRRNRWMKWGEILAPFVIPSVISAIGWLFYHLRYLAELAAKEGQGHR